MLDTEAFIRFPPPPPNFASRFLTKRSLKQCPGFLAEIDERWGLSRRSPAGEGGQALKFYYVYILQSEIDQRKFYTGFTEDLDFRPPENA